MTRYRGVQRVVSAARARRIEAASRQRDESTDPRSLSADDLTSSIYRLQTRNRTGAFRDRIRELLAEKDRRRTGRES